MKAGHPPHDHSNMKRLVYCRYEHIQGLALRQRETLDITICIGSTPITFSYFDLYIYSAYAARTA